MAVTINLALVPVHLTLRAVAWLEGKKHLEAPLAMNACGRPKEPRAGRLDFCGTEDVRGLVTGKQAKILKPKHPLGPDPSWGGFEVWVKRKPRLPTCPECQVILDKALQETRQAA